jgi:two-component system, NtrC family, sensor kinase
MNLPGSVVKYRNEDEVLKTMSDELPVGVCVMQDGRFCYINRAFPFAIGYSVDELVGRDSLDLVFTKDREMVHENTIKMLKGERLSPYQFRVSRKDGSIVWVMGTVKSIQYHGKRATLGSYMEITERKEMEEALKENEERYRELADSITDVFFAMDADLRYTYWNKASEILTGIRMEDALGKSLLEVFPDTPGTRRAEKAYRGVLKTRRPQSFVNDFDIGGKHYLFEINAYPSPGGISVLVRDITMAKQAEEALRRSEERYRTILEEMDDGYFETDLAGNFTFVNNAMASLLGYSKEELIGMNYRAYTPQGDVQAVFEAYNRIYETGKPLRNFSRRVTRKDGSYGFAQSSTHPIRNERNEIIGFRGVRHDITRYKQAEQALRQSEEKYRTILEEMEDAYFEVDLGGHLTFVNNSLCRSLGYSRQELIGMNYKHFTVEDDVESVFQVFNEVYRTGIPNKGCPWKAVRKDGGHGFAETSVSLLRNEKGEIVGFRGVGRDITERKQAEEALKQSEERYRTILEEMEDSYFEVDLGGHFTLVNNSVCRDLGYSREELIGMSYKNYAIEEDRESIFRVFNEVYQTGVPNKGFAWKTIRKDGTHGFAETSVSLLRNSSGEITGFRGVGRDVTERRWAEEKVRQSEENYRALFDSSVIGTIVLDAETTKIIMVNQSAAKMFGFSSPEEAVGVDPVGFVCADDRHRMLNIALKALFERDSRDVHEICMLTKDGREIWISATGARIMHVGKLAGLISFRDITEERQQRERLMMTERLASIGELAAGAAHELNNPLTSIIGFSELLMEKDTPDYIRRDLALIRSEAQRAANVMSNLLTFARKHRPTKQPTQINDLIEDVLRLRAYAYKSHSIEVDRNLAPDLPEIMVDPFQMQQVFLNITINAEYFMSEAHNRGNLIVTTEQRDSIVKLSFTDDGPGVPAENLSRMFDPFFTTKKAGKGTGLGLSICHGIVAEHGGQLYARSELGKGTTIFVELPINGNNHIEDVA